MHTSITGVFTHSDFFLGCQRRRTERIRHWILQGVWVEFKKEKKIDKGVVLVEVLERSTTSRLFSLPEGSLAGKEVSSMPERNKVLQLTREPLREKGWVVEKRAKRGDTLKESRWSVCSQKCVCQYLHATWKKVRSRWGHMQRCVGVYPLLRRGDGRRSITAALCLSFPLLSLFVKPGLCRQWLPAAPSVAAKCPKFISGEKQGRIHQESDTPREETGRQERGPRGQQQTGRQKLTFEAF